MHFSHQSKFVVWSNCHIFSLDVIVRDDVRIRVSIGDGKHRQSTMSTYRYDNINV